MKLTTREQNKKNDSLMKSGNDHKIREAMFVFININ